MFRADNFFCVVRAENCKTIRVYYSKTPKKAIFCHVGVKVLKKLINSEFYLAIMVIEIQKCDKKIVTILPQKFHLCET